MLETPAKNLCTKKTDSIVSQIAEAILLGKIGSDDEITQNNLAKSFEVSRMPVREALITLEYAGLVERLNNQHIKVAHISRDFFYEIFRTAFLLEAELLKKIFSDRNSVEKFPAINYELQFHGELLKTADSFFTKKNLETITDIYISFAVSSKQHDTEKSFSLIKEIFCTAQGNSRNNLLEKYFSQLTDDACFSAQLI